MRPMMLKQPTDCCASPTLLWIVTDGVFSCPCGKFKADVRGQKIEAKFNFGKWGGKRGRPKKGQERKPKEPDFDADIFALDPDTWN